MKELPDRASIAGSVVQPELQISQSKVGLKLKVTLTVASRIKIK